MKRFLIILISVLLAIIPISYADNYDTNYVNGSVSKGSSSSSSSGTGSNDYKYWDYYYTTGTRYVIRVF